MQPIAGFIDQCCLFARNAKVCAIDLYLAYVLWCLDEGVPVQDQFTFVEMIQGLGTKLRHRKDNMWFRGITVLPTYRVTSPK
jgi:hypothetical protein